MANITIADDRDITSILEIYRLNKKEELSPIDLQFHLKTFKSNFKRRTSDFNYFVAKNENDIIIGYQSFSRLFTTPFYKKDWAESSTYVHPKYNNTGIGFKLIRYGLEYLKKTNIKSVFAFTFVDNSAILKMADRLDFTILTRIDGLFFNDKKDRFILVKRINE